MSLNSKIDSLIALNQKENKDSRKTIFDVSKKAA
jgi:hypothetical protein